MLVARQRHSMAKIVYQGREWEDLVSKEVDDEQLNYEKDHWQIHHGGDEYTYIPRERVFSVKMTDPHFLHE